MIKNYCDRCGDEIFKTETHPEGRLYFRNNRAGNGEKGFAFVEWNDMCRKCVIEVFERLFPGEKIND